MFRIVYIYTYSYMHSRKKGIGNSILLFFIFVGESQVVIFKWSMIHLLYICKIKYILKRMVMIISSGRLCKVLVEEEVLFKPTAAFFVPLSHG